MHYTVAVITKTQDEEELEDLLAPYNEDITVAPYVDQTKAEIIAEAKEWQSNILRKQQEGEIVQLSEHDKKLLEAKTDEEFYKANTYEDQKYTDNGDHLTTYNPNSKWDWYVIGGRWSGEIVPNDSIQLKDLPESVALQTDLENKYPDEYKKYQKLITDGDVFYRAEYLRQRYPEFVDYLIARKDVITYAILDENGVWHEPGRMGWFSSMAETDDEVSFGRGYYGFLKKKNPEYYLTIVDCHI